MTGKVKSVNGSPLVVTARVPKGSANSNRQPKLVKRNVKVTLNDSDGSCTPDLGGLGGFPGGAAPGSPPN